MNLSLALRVVRDKEQMLSTTVRVVVLEIRATTRTDRLLSGSVPAGRSLCRKERQKRPDRSR
jgi:hypothetical protein